MKTLLLSAVLSLLSCADVFAATWIVKLDGVGGDRSAGLQFNFGTKQGDPAILYFKTKSGGIFEIDRGRVTSAAENEVMATFNSHKGESGQPMTRVTINRQQRTVNVLYHHPTDSQNNKKEVFGVAKEIHVAP